MKLSFISRVAALTLGLALAFSAAAPVAAVGPAHQPYATARAGLPKFEKFVASVTNGQAGVVRGVYVPGVLALRVMQQPSGQAAYVSPITGTATQFHAAAEEGVIGLLAHNYLSGRSFFGLAVGQEVRIVYGDGAVKRYRVATTLRYQALDPRNPYGDLVDLSTGLQMPSKGVFDLVYTGPDHVTFQTCIARDGDLSWGRLFVIATPLN